MPGDRVPCPTVEFGTEMARWREARYRDVSFNSGPNTPFALRVSAPQAEVVQTPASSIGFEGHAPTPLIDFPELVATVHLVDFGERVTEGHIVVAVVPLWRRLLDAFAKDPDFWMRLTPRQTEEWIAGSYEEDRYKVILTRRTRDGGRDIIATREDLMGSVRIIDDVKTSRPALRSPSTIRSRRLAGTVPLAELLSLTLV